MVRTHRKQEAQTKPNCGHTSGKKKSTRGALCTPNTAHPNQDHLPAEPRTAPMRGACCRSGGLPGHGTKPNTRRSRAHCCLKCCRPEKSRLALVKLKATTKNEQVCQYPLGLCAGVYLFHHFTVSKDSHENLAQIHRWPELSIPSHHI